MAVMTIRDLDDDVRDRIRVRAAHHGRSMEAEVRAILTAAVESPVEVSFASALLALRAAADGAEGLIPPRRDEPRDPFA
jgi:plasmid stability protein